MKKILVFVLVHVLVALAFAIPHSKIQPRIKNGGKAKDGEYPFIVSIRDKVFGEKHHCGATIINDRWVLTAAHCVHQYYAYQLAVLAGSNKLYEGGETYDIEEIVENEDFKWGVTGNDIALMKVSRPFNFKNKNIQAAVLPSESILEDVKSTIVGWGRPGEDEDVPDDLYKLEVKTLSFNTCKERITTNEVSETEICTFINDFSGVCYGDSGGPLVIKNTNKLIGVTSWVVKCGEGIPDVFTRVSSFIDWIYKNSDSW